MLVRRQIIAAGVRQNHSGLVLRLIAGAVLAGTIGACSVNKQVELPTNNSSGSDEMKASPCACQPLDFNSRGYEWAS